MTFETSSDGLARGSADGSAPRLARRLSLGHLVVYGLLFIGPMAPASIFGVLDAGSRGAVALVYVIATLMMACTAWSYGQMSRHVPHAGSVFAYARAGLGAGPGFLAGWMAMLDYLLIPALAFLFSGIAMHALVPVIPSWIFTIVVFVATNALNLAGSRVAARAGSVMLAVEIVVLVLFVVGAVVVLSQHGPERGWLTPFTGAGEGVAITPLMGAVSVAVLSFLGFDAIASFAEENTGDARQVGRAIGICLLLAGVVFVLQSYLAALLNPRTPQLLAANPAIQDTAFYDLTTASISALLGVTITVTKAVGPGFAAMTGQAAAARLLFGMAREGSLPSTLASVDSRRGIPAVALIATAAMTIAVSVWAARRPDGLSVLSSIVNVGALSAFTLLHVSVIGYFGVKRKSPATLAHWIIPALGGAGTLWIIIESSALAQRVAGIWFLLGFAWWWLQGRRRSSAQG
jgi:amino acid transporter